jgi:hypothetical protein
MSIAGIAAAVGRITLYGHFKTRADAAGLITATLLAAFTPHRGQ